MNKILSIIFKSKSKDLLGNPIKIHFEMNSVNKSLGERIFKFIWFIGAGWIGYYFFKYLFVGGTSSRRQGGEFGDIFDVLNYWSYFRVQFWRTMKKFV
jgi:hypothetical protein